MATRKTSKTFSKTNLPKIGRTVTFTRRNGERVTGKVHSGDESGASGAWVTVNIGDKKKPVLVNTRPSQLTPV